MTEDEVGATVLGVIFGMAILAGIIATIKKRNAFGWFIGTLMFPPLLLLILFLSSKRGAKAKAGKPDMPSWTQPPAVEQGGGSPADVQAALRRAERQTESAASKRVLAIAARAAAQAEKRQRRENRGRPRRERPARKRRDMEQPAEPQPEPLPSATLEDVWKAAKASQVRKVRDRERQARRGAVQRRGSRETRIYRRT